MCNCKEEVTVASGARITSKKFSFRVQQIDVHITLFSEKGGCIYTVFKERKISDSSYLIDIIFSFSELLST